LDNENHTGIKDLFVFSVKILYIYIALKDREFSPVWSKGSVANASGKER